MNPVVVADKDTKSTHLLHLSDHLLAFRRLFAKFPLMQILAYLHTSLNMGTVCRRIGQGADMKKNFSLLNTLQELFDNIRKIIELGGFSESEWAWLRLLT